MKLFKVWQTKNMEYDTYDSMIVAAESEEDAKNMHPDGAVWDNENDKYPSIIDSWCWTEPKNVHVEYIGEAKEGTKKCVILASYNAG